MKRLEVAAKERQAITGTRNSPFTLDVAQIPQLSDDEKGRAREQAAAIVGTSPRYMQD